jgi:hypothetical protein
MKTHMPRAVMDLCRSHPASVPTRRLRRLQLV